MGADACKETADSMTEDGVPGQISKMNGIHHGYMGTQIAAPAHAHRSEDSNIVACGQASFNQLWHQADGRSCCSQSRNRN